MKNYETKIYKGIEFQVYWEIDEFGGGREELGKYVSRPSGEFFIHRTEGALYQSVYDEQGDCIEIPLATNLSKGGYLELGYFEGFMHLPHNPGNWAHVSQAEIDECFERAMQHGPVRLKGSQRFADHGIYPDLEGYPDKSLWLDVLYSCEDYETAERYNNGSTWDEVCAVKFRGITLDSVGGVNEDCGEEHRRKIEQDCLAQSWHELGEWDKEAYERLIARMTEV